VIRNNRLYIIYYYYYIIIYYIYYRCKYIHLYFKPRRFSLLFWTPRARIFPRSSLLRRRAGGTLGIWEGRVNWVKGSKWGQFTSNLRGRWTIPVTTGGCQVSGRGHKGEEKGSLAGGARGARGVKGIAPCIYVTVVCVRRVQRVIELLE
jgi:hypothetical protein